MGLTSLDTLHEHAGNSRQAPKQSYLSRTSSSAGLRGSMPGMRASMMKGGRAPKAPAEIPLGTSQRVWMPLTLCCACSVVTLFAPLPAMVPHRWPCADCCLSRILVMLVVMQSCPSSVCLQAHCYELCLHLCSAVSKS